MSLPPLSAIAISLSIALTGIAAAAVVAPVMVVNTATITKDSVFSNEACHPVISTDSTTDPQGFAVQRTHATAWRQSSVSHSFPTGGGTLIMDNSWQYDSEQRERIVQTANSFRFDATTSIHTTLDFNAQIWNSGNFSTVVTAPYTNSIYFHRSFRFTLDGPMQLHARFSGISSNDGASFKDMFNSLALSGGQFGFADRVFMTSATVLKTEATTTFSGGGTRMGVSYELSGFADDSEIDLTFNISPEVAGTTQELEFRWFLRHELDGGADPTARSVAVVVDANAEISESVTLTAVPEASTLAVASLGLAFACRRRRNPAIGCGPQAR